MVKYNTDGACQGNPRIRALAFFIRNDKGDLVFDKPKGLGRLLIAEALAIIEALI